MKKGEFVSRGRYRVVKGQDLAYLVCPSLIGDIYLLKQKKMV